MKEDDETVNPWTSTPLSRPDMGRFLWVCPKCKLPVSFAVESAVLYIEARDAVKKHVSTHTVTVQSRLAGGEHCD